MRCGTMAQRHAFYWDELVYLFECRVLYTVPPGVHIVHVPVYEIVLNILKFSIYNSTYILPIVVHVIWYKINNMSGVFLKMNFHVR